VENFAFKGQGEGDDCLPTFLHKSTGLEVKLVFGGSYRMGLSEDEEAAAEDLWKPIPMDLNRMRPVHEVTVSPFFVTRYPILPKQFTEIAGIPYSDSFPPRKGMPVRCTHDEARQFAQHLEGRLPVESEWEYFCRGGTTSLFFFGNTLPDEEELECLVRHDFESFSAVTHNRFGLYGLFSGEWCEDEYRGTHASDAVPDGNLRVGRGGGSQLWPWQGGAYDWVWCVSANRCGLPARFEKSNDKSIRSFMLEISSKNAFRVVWDCGGTTE
jgi:formylglycine-generating enzyme required for sulfatase activity